MAIILNSYQVMPSDHTLSVDYQASYYSTSTSSPITFSDCTFGAAHVTRRMYVIVYLNIEAYTLPSAVSIGGVAASLEVQNTDTHGRAACSIWSADVPTGSTGAVVVTVVNPDPRPVCIDVYSVVGYTPETAATYNTAFEYVDMRSGGVGIFAYAMTSDATPTDDTAWIGATKQVYYSPASFHKHTSAIFNANYDDEYHFIGVSGASFYGSGYIGISLRPAGGMSSDALPSGVITMQNIANSFSSILETHSSANVLWTYAGGTSSSLTPTFATGAAGEITLQVTPWHALKTLNIGYGENDGASYQMSHLAAQSITTISNLQVARNLQVFTADGVHFNSNLNLSNMSGLNTVECYMADLPFGITLSGNMATLSRLCLEDSGITSLNVAECPMLSDLRGAVNEYVTNGLVMADWVPYLWHFCVRDSNIPNALDYILRFPKLQECWIWNTGATGAVEFVSPDIRSVLVAYNPGITSINVAGRTAVFVVDAAHCALNQAAIDSVLAQVDAYGTVGQNIFLNGTLMGVPSANGEASITSLESRGWTVTTNA